MRCIVTLLVAAQLVLDLRHDRRREGGSVTIEHVIWAVAFIAIAGIVVVAIRTYVTTQAGNIQ
ncbi:hypothetical protein EXE58_18880 [Nocardioides seonyuensis]|uniref:Uncharacterized protein n=1 Tax=Nocardioides seonyuensis TaxID=2518371 RepID=A0A4P7IIR6_9ACTN|nr:hypothetical protein [Nocardioides seonyuensis]QBX57286.1 hypothetical protein EXE58_18880 [Nocardioides seonyuensis]